MSLDAVLRAHLRQLKSNRRVIREAAAGRGAPKVDLGAVARFRARSAHLDRRLPADAHRDAAFGGLQDTVPRAALTSLHARLEGVAPDSWEHPSLVQVWFRFSDYVVPAADFAVFTLGALPRDPQVAVALEVLGSEIERILERPRDSREVEAATGAALARGGHALSLREMMLLRIAQPTGRFRIRWDARHVTLFPTPRPQLDPEPMRLELARRFLHWHGPAGPEHFAWWAAVTIADARRTWGALRDELIEVSLEGRARWLLAGDQDALLDAAELEGVRFLPHGDPHLTLDRDLVEGDEVDRLGRKRPPPSRDDRGRGLTQRLLNSLVGRVLVDGRLAGSWGRERSNLSVHLWPGAGEHRDRVLAEAGSMAVPIGSAIQVRELG